MKPIHRGRLRLIAVYVATALTALTIAWQASTALRAAELTDYGASLAPAFPEPPAPAALSGPTAPSAEYEAGRGRLDPATKAATPVPPPARAPSGAPPSPGKTTCPTALHVVGFREQPWMGGDVRVLLEGERKASVNVLDPMEASALAQPSLSCFREGRLPEGEHLAIHWGSSVAVPFSVRCGDDASPRVRRLDLPAPTQVAVFVARPDELPFRGDVRVRRLENRFKWSGQADLQDGTHVLDLAPGTYRITAHSSAGGIAAETVTVGTAPLDVLLELRAEIRTSITVNFKADGRPLERPREWVQAVRLLDALGEELNAPRRLLRGVSAPLTLNLATGATSMGALSEGAIGVSFRLEDPGDYSVRFPPDPAFAFDESIPFSVEAGDAAEASLELQAN